MQLLGQIPDPSNVIDTASRYSWEAGLLAFLVVAGACGLAYAGHKIIWFAVYKILGNEEKQTRGILGEWVDVEKAEKKANTDTLKCMAERLEKQTEVCSAHVDTVKVLGDTLAQQTEAARSAQKSAAEAAAAVAEGNKHLAHLVELHEKPGATIHQATVKIGTTADDMTRMKAAARRACTMCRTVAAKECPNSAAEVDKHCDEIERIIGEA